jgi:Protein of unknown function (DUF2283)
MPGNIGSVFAGGRFFPIRMMTSFWSWPWPLADTLYINFKKPSNATDSDLTDDDVIIRCEDGEVIGLTILHASNR